MNLSLEMDLYFDQYNIWYYLLCFLPTIRIKVVRNIMFLLSCMGSCLGREILSSVVVEIKCWVGLDRVANLHCMPMSNGCRFGD